MGITRIRGLLAIGIMALVLVGCASKEPEVQADGAPDASEPIDQSPADTISREEPAEPQRPTVDRQSRITVFEEPGDTRGETLQGVFYFDFDQAIVKRAGHTELDKHAEALMQERSLRLRLEGHADERGTREYNLALGERRANAVRAYLAAQGVSRSQIEVISYGEEKPVVTGGGESAWAQNRRVEFKYR